MFRLVDFDAPLKAEWLKPYQNQLNHNHGRIVSELSGVLTCEQLWLAAHGRPIMDRQVSPQEAHLWVQALVVNHTEKEKAEAKPTSSKKKESLFSASESEKKG